MSMSANVQTLVQQFTEALVAAIHAEIRERALAAVASIGGGEGRMPKGSSAGKAIASPRREVRMTPKLAAGRKLQGRYLGTLRGLPPDLRARVQKVAREKGVAEALKFSQTLRR